VGEAFPFNQLKLPVRTMPKLPFGVMSMSFGR